MTGQSQTAGYSRTYASVFGRREAGPTESPCTDGYLHSGSQDFLIPLHQWRQKLSPRRSSSDHCGGRAFDHRDVRGRRHGGQRSKRAGPTRTPLQIFSVAMRTLAPSTTIPIQNRRTRQLPTWCGLPGRRIPTGTFRLRADRGVVRLSRALYLRRGLAHAGQLGAKWRRPAARRAAGVEAGRARHAAEGAI